MIDSVTAAYDRTGAAWQTGPSRIYDRLADVVLGLVPVAWPAARVLDLGAGTGAATRAVQARGGTVVALDAAFGMLAENASARPPGAVGDALALPFVTGTFDVVVAAFSLNHLLDPVSGLREAARVIRPGGSIVATAYTDGDDHPVKEAVGGALAARAWSAPPWYWTIKRDAVPRLATVERARAATVAAGLDATVESLEVVFADLCPTDLVEWRLGMAHTAPFVGGLDPRARAALVADALDRLGADPPPLRRPLILVHGRHRR